jgi:hypothetical protein
MCVMVFMCFLLNWLLLVLLVVMLLLSKDINLLVIVTEKGQVKKTSNSYEQFLHNNYNYNKLQQHTNTIAHHRPPQESSY